MSDLRFSFCCLTEYVLVCMIAGGLKLWEGSLDLITALSSELEDGELLFTGKRVLEVGS